MDRAAIRERDQWQCARCGLPWPEHIHHRVLRAQGGPDTFPNLVCLCTSCHTWAHHNPGDAMGDGWIVPGWRDPGEVPVGHHAWGGQQVWLRGDGTVGFDAEGCADGDANTEQG